MSFVVDRPSRSSSFAAALLALLASTAVAAPPTPPTTRPVTTLAATGPWLVTITDLGVLPGGIYSSAYGINDAGKIVGMAYDASGALKTVQWNNGQIAVIPGLSPSAASVPYDVNDVGQIAGTLEVGGQDDGIYWDAQNNAFKLPGLPGVAASWVRANAINSSGLLVGRAQEGGPNLYAHAVIWNTNSFQTDLGFMGGGTYSEAFGINDLGQVVGVASIANTNQHAFLWQNGQFTDLSTWTGGGVSSRAYAINDSGQIVGLNKNVASIWEAGTVKALPMPPGVSAFTPALDINDAGDVIATGSTGFPNEVGVLWRDGTPIALGTLPGGNTSRARRINDAGEIIGEARAASGFFHAVKWTVTPLPWTDLGHGLAGSTGVPQLSGTGTLALGASIDWSLTNAKPNAPAWVVVGASRINAPFFGGTLVPAPNLVLAAGTDAQGELPLALVVPTTLPSGVEISVQVWIQDAAATAGFAASNAIAKVTP